MFMQIIKNKILIFVVIMVAAFATWVVYKDIATVIVGNKYSFSYNDINNLYNAEQKLAAISGKSLVSSNKDVLYNLVLSSMQKIILLEKGIKVDKNKAIKFIEESNKSFKGILVDIKQELGNNYFKLLIEPIAISQAFLRFYQFSVNSTVNTIFTAVKKQGLSVTAKQINKKIVKLPLEKNKNKDLAAEFNKNYKTNKNNEIIYSKVVKIGNSFAILRLNSIDDKNINTDALFIDVVAYRYFLSQLVKDITVDFPVTSLYNIEDIYNKKGSIYNEGNK